MSLIQQLGRLQVMDQEWDTQARLYQSIRQRLTDRSALEQKRATQLHCVQALAATRTQLQDAELELASVQQKAREIDASLYSGSILAPRELDNLRKESDYTRRHVGQLEESILEQMATVERLEAENVAADHELREIETQSAKETETLAPQFRTLQAQLQQLKESREKVRASIGVADLALYDSLRAKKGGVALAPMREGVCQICHVTSSARKVETVAAGDEIVTCEGCGRILYQG